MAKTKTGVGYRQPPKKHCWKKGQSGNPKGRPRGHKNLAAALTAILHENIRVNLGGKEQEMSKLEAVTRQLVDKAIAGDARLTQLLLNEVHKNEAKAERDDPTKPLGLVDRDVLDAFFARIRVRNFTTTGTSRCWRRNSKACGAGKPGASSSICRPGT